MSASWAPRPLLLWAMVLTSVSHHDAIAQIMLGTPTRLGPLINTQTEHELAPELSADGLSLYYQVGVISANPDIYVASRDSLDSPWNDPRPIGSPINTQYFEIDPALSPDSRELFFSDGTRPGFAISTRPGGLGGPDIWASVWNEEVDSWDEPRNLGQPINSPYHDYAPNLSADGLEMIFSSNRPGGMGAADLWAARRPTLADAWSEPTHLGPVLNSTADDENAAISPDGRLMIFGSSRPGAPGFQSNLWASARETIEGDWSQPIPLNSINSLDFYWTLAPDFSTDGTVLYYSRYEPPPGPKFEVVQVPLLPAEPALIETGSVYQQSFDEALGTDPSDTSVRLPNGWTGSNNTIFAQNVVTGAFFSGRATDADPGDIFNAGLANDPDRALATGVSRSGDGNELQFRAQVQGGAATQMRLQFDVEAWATATASPSAPPGEAAFRVIAELDEGDGFAELLDLGTVTTGPNLVYPTEGLISGNDPAFRMEFDSGWQDLVLPEDSLLRLRWITDTQAATAGWTFGLDSVVLSLLGGFSGDYNGSGAVEQGDLDLVLLHWGVDAIAAPASWIHDLPDGRIDQDELDRVLLNWGAAAAAGSSPAGVPEPSTGLVAAIVLGVGGAFAYRSNRKREKRQNVNVSCSISQSQRIKP